MLCSGRFGGTVTTTSSTPGLIRTPDQRIRVFLSSTLGELAAERAVVRRAVEQLRLIPVMFELGARPHPPRELYRAYLAQSHVFLGLYWQRYGWVAPGEEISGLEDEFRLGQDMPRLIYIKEPAPEREERLVEMLGRLETEGAASYRRFTDPDELERLVQDDLAVLLTERFVSSLAAPTTAAGPSLRRPGFAMSPPPVPLTATVGREHEIARIEQQLRDGVRLLTLSGPGGIGKSRLALEVATRVRDHFTDGVVLVPLESVEDPSRLPSALRERLGVSNPNGRPDLDVLVDALSHTRLLLILDNFEQLVAAAPELGQLLDLCPGVSALVTSRQVLRLRAEHEHAVGPLEHDDAVDLFVQRAAAARDGFHLTDVNRAAVEELCRRLDGLPLALELAAARIRLLPPDVLLARLEQRLDLLTSGAADLPARQRTLRATLDWSHRLLDEPERALLARLSVFAGGATIDAVEAVCADVAVPDVMETLSSLLEKSLLVSVTDASGRPRLQLLQVVRDYAAERLAERGGTDELRRRHAQWFADLAEPADIALHEDAHHHWGVLEADIDNLRAAGRWALDSRDVELAAALARRTWAWVWQTGRMPEFRHWLEQVLPVVTADHDLAVRGTLTFGLCESRYMLGDLTGAAELIDRSISLLAATDEPGLLATARMSRVTMLVGLGLVEEVRADAEAAVEVARRCGNRWLLGYATAIRGTYRMITGDLAGARVDQEESLELALRIELDVLAAQSHGQLVWLHLLEVGAGAGAGLDDARWHLQQQFDLLVGTGNLEGLGYALDAAAGVALSERRWRAAARALGAAAGIRERLRMPAWPMMAGFHESYVGRVRDVLGHAVTTEIMNAAADEDPWSVPVALVEHRTGAVSPA